MYNKFHLKFLLIIVLNYYYLWNNWIIYNINFKCVSLVPSTSIVIVFCKKKCTYINIDVVSNYGHIARYNK